MNLIFRKALTTSILIICFTLTSVPVIGQSSLPSKYQEMMEKSETYEQYKVIRTTRLNDFWSEVEDTLNLQRRKIMDLDASIGDLDGRLRQQQAKIDSLTTDLQASQEVNNSINFLGIDFQKGVYHTFVWAIIGGISAAFVVLLGMYKRSNKITVRNQKDFQKLEADFESHKDSSREKYLKIKRELQTALNKIEDMRKSKSARNGVKETT